MAVVVLDDGRLGEVSESMASTISYKKLEESIFAILTDEEKEELSKLYNECYVPVVPDIFSSNSNGNEDKKKFGLYKYFELISLSNFFNYNFDELCTLLSNSTDYNSLFKNLLGYKRDMEFKTSILIDTSEITGKENSFSTIKEFSLFLGVSVEQVYNYYSKGLTAKKIYDKVDTEKKRLENIKGILNVICIDSLRIPISIETYIEKYNSLIKKKYHILNTIIDSDATNYVFESRSDYLCLFINDYNNCSVDYYTKEDCGLIDNNMDSCNNIALSDFSKLINLAITKKPDKDFNTYLINKIYKHDNLEKFPKFNEEQRGKIISISKNKK